LILRAALLFLIGLAATGLLTAALVRLAPRLGLLDFPGGRKSHEGAVPLVGGLAMGVVFLACFGIFRVDGEVSLWFGAAVAIVLACGVLDDHREVGSMTKFGFQILAAWVLVQFGGSTLAHLGDLLSAERLSLGVVAIPFTVFAIVGVMNAVNLADGLDGLAGGLALVATAWFGAAAALAGDGPALWVACLLAGQLIAFLAFNAPLPGRGRALVFLGDAGSLFLGLVLAWLAIRLSMDPVAGLSPITAVWILGIPLADTVALMLRRLLRGGSPFRPDTEHLHHLLLTRDLGRPAVTALMLGASATMGAAGLAAERADVPDFVMFYIYGVLWIVYYLATSAASASARRAEHRTGLSAP
jgi:UDP-GlcNAc:undecaprenyl-phosphate/decaprenyl-phosphate GlcNAc-1-phosphate transferase